MLYLLIGLCILFGIYEHNLHKKYEMDIKKEKLIADFSYFRMQIIKMLYQRETTKDSCFFNFMFPATSYAIRALYFDKKTVDYLTHDKFLDNLLNLLKNKNMKEEFKHLDREQKIIFARTILNLLVVYSETNIYQKIIFRIYKLKIQKIFLSLLMKILHVFQPNIPKIIENLRDIDISYSVEQYAMAA